MFLSHFYGFGWFLIGLDYFLEWNDGIMEKREAFARDGDLQHKKISYDFIRFSCFAWISDVSETKFAAFLRFQAIL